MTAAPIYHRLAPVAFVRSVVFGACVGAVLVRWVMPALVGYPAPGLPQAALFGLSMSFTDELIGAAGNRHWIRRFGIYLISILGYAAGQWIAWLAGYGYPSLGFFVAGAAGQLGTVLVVLHVLNRRRGHPTR